MNSTQWEDRWTQPLFRALLSGDEFDNDPETERGRASPADTLSALRPAGAGIHFTRPRTNRPRDAAVQGFSRVVRIVTGAESTYTGRVGNPFLVGVHAMRFAEKLRKLRDAAGLSEAKLAEASGLTFASVHQYGLGRRKPSYAAVVKLSRALGVNCRAFEDCDDVLDGEEEAERPRKKPGGRSRKSK